MRNILSDQAHIDRGVTFEAPVRIGRGAEIRTGARFGRYSYVSPNSYVGEGCVIGRFCSIARNCEVGAIGHPTDYLSSHPFQYSQFHFRRTPGYKSVRRVEFDRLGPTVLGNDVWLGSHAVVLRGVSIGDGAIVAAGAVVTQDVAPYTIVGGLPAGELKPRFDPGTIRRLLAAQWWDLPFDVISTLQFDDIDAALNQIETYRARVGTAP